VLTVITGLPGSGKSLWSIAHLLEKFKGSDRQVYVSGIPDLKVPGWLELENPTQWMTLPSGSVVLVDEAQRFWRNRARTATVPAHTAALETHRHGGYDLFLITQHPKLLDPAVCELCGRHIHIKRKFGMHLAQVLEWPEIRWDPSRAFRDAVVSTFKYPREVFALYRSADMHTHKRSIPMRLYMMVFLPILAIGALVYSSLSWWKSHVEEPVAAASEKKQSAVDGAAKSAQPGPTRVSSVGAPGGRPGRALTREEWLDERNPRLAELPHTAPIYDRVMQAKVAPQPSACVSSGSRCTCYTGQATVIAGMSDSLCRDIVRHGWFDATAQSVWGPGVVGPGAGSRAPSVSEGAQAIRPDRGPELAAVSASESVSASVSERPIVPAVQRPRTVMGAPAAPASSSSLPSAAPAPVVLRGR